MGRTRGAHKSAQKEEKLVDDDEEEVVVEAADTIPTPPPAKKPRRKSQAFGVPKTAALKAKIDQNVAGSPLLRLPREVRARIWNLVIGDRLFHIKSICGHHGHSNCYCYSRSKKQRTWTTSCCLLSNSENDLFQRSKIGVEELVTQDEAKYGQYLDAAALTKLSSCPAERAKERQQYLQRYPHDQCQEYIKDVREGKYNLFEGRPLELYKAQDHVVQVQILQVCRQVYIEANPILWSSNTFAFSRVLEFCRFLSDRIASQKASITKLLIDLSQSDGTWNNIGDGPKATTSAILKSLTGLRTLHLHLQDEMNGRWMVNAGPIDVKQEIANWRIAAKSYESRERFTNFKRLPLHEVTVLIMADPATLGQCIMQDWRHAESIKFAEAIRNTILDPDGPQKFQQEEAVRATELAKSQLVLDPCEKASTTEECAKLHQEELDNKKVRRGKPISSRPKAAACKYEHLCLICIETLRRTREDARQCQKPGKCDEAYFAVIFKHCDSMAFSRLVPIQAEETASIILARYISVKGWNKDASYSLRIDGAEVKPEATVRELGLEKGTKTSVLVEVVKKKDIRSPTSASNSSVIDNAS